MVFDLLDSLVNSSPEAPRRQQAALRVPSSRLSKLIGSQSVKFDSDGHGKRSDFLLQFIPRDRVSPAGLEVVETAIQFGAPFLFRVVLNLGWQAFQQGINDGSTLGRGELQCGFHNLLGSRVRFFIP